MEELWKIEEKWKLSTKEAILVFTCISILLVLLCIVTTLRKILSTKNKSQQHAMITSRESRSDSVFGTNRGATRSGRRWDTVKRVLMTSVRWSGPNLEERRSGVPLLGSSLNGWNCGKRCGSPVWQRPILMGEKCELPRFSGLILYDEKGLPLHNSVGSDYVFEVNKSDVVRTTLKDLL